MKKIKAILKLIFSSFKQTVLPEEQKTEDMVGRLMTPEEVAKYFVVHPRTIRRWYKDGKLKGMKLSPGTTRIFERSVQELIKKCEN